MDGKCNIFKDCLEGWRGWEIWSVFHPLCDGGLSTKERERESDSEFTPSVSTLELTREMTTPHL